MGHQNARNCGATAKGKGALKKRRRHRAWRREETKEIREAINVRMRAEGHPGWRRS
ncbi:MAG: hypothetical protein ABIQ04_02010 [Candidatus Saccharimonadales bacterium]